MPINARGSEPSGAARSPGNPPTTSSLEGNRVKRNACKRQNLRPNKAAVRFRKAPVRLLVGHVKRQSLPLAPPRTNHSANPRAANRSSNVIRPTHPPGAQRPERTSPSSTLCGKMAAKMSVTRALPPAPYWLGFAESPRPSLARPRLRQKHRCDIHHINPRIKPAEDGVQG